MRLEGKTAIVTGAASGIGLATAKLFASEGAAIVAADWNQERLDAAVAEIENAGGRVTGVQGDISDQASAEGLIDIAVATFGGLDVLVNNAGIDGPRQVAWEADLESWRRVIDIDLLGAFDCSRQALQRMVRQGKGVVLTITSVHEVIPWSGYSAYTAAKAAAGMMVKTLAQEAGPHGVRVLAIAPGAVKTDINKNVWSDPESRKDLLSKIPFGRLAEPEEIADLAVLLASDAAGYVTGTTVYVDGAMTTYPSFAHGG